MAPKFMTFPFCRSAFAAAAVWHLGMGSVCAQTTNVVPNVVGAKPAVTTDQDRAAETDAKMRAERALKQLAIDAEKKPAAADRVLLFRSESNNPAPPGTTSVAPAVPLEAQTAPLSVPAIPVQVPLPQATQRFSPEQLQDASRFTARGTTLLTQGDIIQARGFLERAADLGSPAAALTLAQTFDDRAFKKWRIVGLVANKERAVFWYMKAQMLGSREASDALASLSP